MSLQDVAAERVYLTGLIKYGKNAYIDVGHLVDVNDMTIDQNQSMLKILKHLFEKDIDYAIDIPSIMTTANELGIRDLLEDDKQYVNKLFNFFVEESNLRGFAQKIKRLSITRQLVAVADDLKRDLYKITGNEPLSDIIGLAENKVLNFSHSLSANSDDQITDINDGLEEWLNEAESNPVETIGLPTGYTIFDRVTGGLRRKTVTVIAARSGVGKSLFGDNILLRVGVKQKVPVLMLDSEMDKTIHWSRILSILSEAGITEIENGTYSYSDDKKSRVRKGQKILKGVSYSYKNVSGASFDEILSHARRWVIQTVGKTNGVTNDCLFCFDYIKVMNEKEINNNMSEAQALGFYASRLHDFAVMYDVPVLCFAQLNRDNIVSDSDKIQRYIDNLFYYHVKTTEEMAETGPMAGNRKMVPIKARQGQLLEYGDYINYNHIPGTAMIKEGETRNNTMPKGQFVVE